MSGRVWEGKSLVELILLSCFYIEGREVLWDLFSKFNYVLGIVFSIRDLVGWFGYDRYCDMYFKIVWEGWRERFKINFEVIDGG